MADLPDLRCLLAHRMNVVDLLPDLLPISCSLVRCRRPVRMGLGNPCCWRWAAMTDFRAAGSCLMGFKRGWTDLKSVDWKIVDGCCSETWKTVIWVSSSND
ncbi:hypothetical protein ACLOJK_035335 [Asimina triloba]